MYYIEFVLDQCGKVVHPVVAIQVLHAFAALLTRYRVLFDTHAKYLDA
jgi:hypothetical protein